MADKKISALGSVSVPTGADTIPIINSAETRKIDLTTLFGKIPGDFGYAGITKHNGTPQTLSGADAVSITTEFTIIDNQSGLPMAVTLANGTNGQTKTLVCSNASATTTLTATQSGFTNIQFTAANQTVTLKYISTKWYIIASYGVTIN